jgi:seryl-tRNA synthetase
MLDLKFIRDNPDAVRKASQDKGIPCDLDRILALDAEVRQLKTETQQLEARRNAANQDVAKAKKSGQPADALLAELKKISDTIKANNDKLRDDEAQLASLLLTVPNVPHPSVPIGKTPADNVVASTWGAPPQFEFEPKPHWELTEKLGIIDFERGAKITGSGFPVFVGLGAKLERGLIQFFIDTDSREGGYTEISPPVVINADSARGTGQLPDKEDLMYVVERDGFYLAPTAEVPVTNLHRDEVLDEKRLPIKYCAYTPCFRREAGSYGKDVKGLNRLHQFDKVELVKFVQPDKSYDELESLRADAERLLQRLGLHYRVLLMCTGDMGFTQTKKYDLEVWSAGQQKWLEVSSCSNFEAFQARRMNIRFRSGATGKLQHVHTLNGSGLALPRTVAALIENNQTADGHIRIPEALRPYLGGVEQI